MEIKIEISRAIQKEINASTTVRTLPILKIWWISISIFDKEYKSIKRGSRFLVICLSIHLYIYRSIPSRIATQRTCSGCFFFLTPYLSFVRHPDMGSILSSPSCDEMQRGFMTWLMIRGKNWHHQKTFLTQIFQVSKFLLLSLGTSLTSQAKRQLQAWQESSQGTLSGSPGTETNPEVKKSERRSFRRSFFRHICDSTRKQKKVEEFYVCTCGWTSFFLISLHIYLYVSIFMYM